ncbi:unnamed protein product [Angiostrongylus costaricensis]|uniref:Cell division protein FtsZ n=1 Tax=Angiostrongylus costaricensis TaxID=334426 RepID=A0A0R3PEM3_ANGCS|nr:unnamed protein product [Angiostrongylus costaricensis]
MILFGGNHLYVFNNPIKSGARTHNTYEAAQKEIAQGAGIAIINGGNKSKADLILEEELISIMSLVYRANAIAVELNRNVKFELVLVSPEMRGIREGLTEVRDPFYEAPDSKTSENGDSVPAATCLCYELRRNASDRRCF